MNIESIATPLVKCPACEGVGEIIRNATRSEWGVWEGDQDPCLVCLGEGEVTLSIYDSFMEWENSRG